MQNSPEGKFILKKLQKELPRHLLYHDLGHTLDVYQCAASIARAEHVDGKALKLLLIAALYHDSGYLKHRKDHEEQSCIIAADALRTFGYSEEDIAEVCRLIMATRIPQQPRSLAEQILCDADLDYLGREDFAANGKKLYEEMHAEGLIDNEDTWDQMQIDFLKQHHYFTATSISRRNATKELNINALL
ncbi:HD domain-containing protein [Pedobacter duraquae]|uniref:HD domain-containing protein n=1 Tax=Pedobacter duraquae TaxID=425511 RepID=A0A4R6IKJ2_9SPHI|nr:HD domain-containing protein [Pedobacter duraquae]TDO22475.1 HD domain-containing protein [Pedobacter duraquae]